jgi:hypothetical protein
MITWLLRQGRAVNLNRGLVPDTLRGPASGPPGGTRPAPSASRASGHLCLICPHTPRAFEPHMGHGYHLGTGALALSYPALILVQ